MADVVELSPEALARFEFDLRGVQYPYNSRTPWSLPMEQTSSRAPSQRMANVRRSTSPLQGFTQDGFEQFMDQRARTLMPDWQIPTTTTTTTASTTSAPQTGYSLNTTFPQQYTEGYAMPYQMSPTDFIQSQPELDTSFPMENACFSMLNPNNTATWNSQAVHADIMDFPINTAGMANMNLQQQNFPDNSPTDTSEIRSLTSSSSDHGWKSSERRPPSLDSSLYDGQNGSALYIGQIHHEPTFSDSSFSEIEFPLHHPWNSYVDVPIFDNNLSSPESESVTDKDYHHVQFPFDRAQDQDEDRDLSSSPVMISSSTVMPIDIKAQTPPQRSPISTGRSSPQKRRPRKDTNPKTNKTTIRRTSQVPKPETEKKVGRRKGPLRPEQRKQACEIRKLGACLRCRFLKKTVCFFPPDRCCNNIERSSVTKASLAEVVNHHMLVYGKYRVHASTSKRLPTS